MACGCKKSAEDRQQARAERAARMAAVREQRLKQQQEVESAKVQTQTTQ